MKQPVKNSQELIPLWEYLESHELTDNLLLVYSLGHYKSPGRFILDEWGFTLASVPHSDWTLQENVPMKTISVDSVMDFQKSNPERFIEIIKHHNIHVVK